MLMKNNLCEMDIAIRVLSDVSRKNQEHYAKFVSFVVDNILYLIRKQEVIFEKNCYHYKYF